MEASAASMLELVTPVVGVFLGVYFLSESLSVLQGLVSLLLLSFVSLIILLSSRQR